MPISADQGAALDAQAVNNFREYLQIPSVHPNVNYEPCVKFLQSQAEGLGLPIKIVTIVTGKPIVIITWVGQDPKLPSILLNSHMDVVPVFEESWTYKPFSAHVDEKGDIYARGTQDMKCVGIQYLEAIRRLKLEGVTLKRTLHISFVPDEEIGGVDGMKKFVHTEEFKKLNVGFALDEGMASEDDTFALFYGERNIWHLIIHCPGTPGHGSLLLKDTAGEKVSYILNKFFEFRKQQVKKLADNPNLTLGDVTTVNLTQIQGGVQSNVVPPEMVITIDCRIAVTVDNTQWEKQVKQWCSEAGSDVWIEWEQKEPPVAATKLDSSNPFWLAFKEATDKLNLKLRPIVCPGGTDLRFIRGVGVRALGFSPMNHTKLRLHRENEYLNKGIFLKGIHIYCHILSEIGNVP
ncbi:aminoacylase-1-like isoform X2 [Anthonomus grandis grandis]|uniref:aminoacylase-1-like isoform X2 n=1 Tax=Anthonomus grandis grandis TaxID=2921223 RepID=UPI002165BC5A|nr:aminoacylase-1-like isoform X2 [Anthonomus grandis grandis]